MSDTDGGQAFPVQPYVENGRTVIRPAPGMSLRDWFAGQALSNPAICTGKDHDYNLRRWFGERGGVTCWEIAAAQAREFADALLAERERK